MKGLPLYIGVCCMAIAGCRHPGARGFTVKGTVTGIPVEKVYLVSDPYDNSKPPLVFDSCKVDHEKFVLRGPYSANQTSYRVMFGDPEQGGDILVIDDVSNVSLFVDGSRNGQYSVSGSPASERYRLLVDSLQRFMQGNRVRDTLAPQDSAARAVALARIRTFYGLLENTVRTDPSPALAAFALSVFSVAADPDEAGRMGLVLPDFQDSRLTSLAQMLQAKFPDNTDVLEVTGLSLHMATIPRVGKELTNLDLPDTSGKPFMLSSLRGKYVLLDFWASWCAPCRAENPNVVRAFQQFRDKNFTVVGVSLDQDKGDWLRAIRQDHLDWTQVSDLRQWQSRAVTLYQFNSIPYNILLDPAGRVIATELRGPALEEKLGEVLK